MGLPLPPSPPRANVCPQFLACPRWFPCPSLESAKLSRALHQSSLLPGFPAHRAHSRFRDPLLPPPRLSARVLSLLPRRAAQRTPLSTRDLPSLGQLSRPWLRLENHPRQRRRAQRFPPIPPHHPRSRQLLPL